ncbi:MAG: DNA-directed RNA polymerase subunit alpha C-terminal domain-containing protein [Chloroflexota bacterium]|nr:DNA-directed RNA polymerase subunit alpha C-terminal domain-containing protein [Chloroflexota bacterium]
MEELAAKEAEKTSPERLIAELDLSKRAVDALAKADITNVGHAMEKLEAGEASLLSVDGFGRKSLADLKKRLRQHGYELPEAAQEIVV